MATTAEATHAPPLSRRLTQGLSTLALGAPPLAVVAEGAGQEAQPASENYRPLQNEGAASVAQPDRERVRENQRIIVAQLVQEALPLVIFIALIVVLYVCGALAIFVGGWTVFFKFSDKPCDQPLRAWVLVVLWVPILKVLRGLLFLTGWSPTYQQFLRQFDSIADPVGTITGASMFWSVEKCDKTAPELYMYTKIYLIFDFSVSVAIIVMSCSAVSVIVWLRRQGYLDGGPGRAMAARPGLVEEIETVQFNSALSGRGEDDTSECPVCSEEFTDGQDIKRTPCDHYFCEACLKKWLMDYGKTCPLCRADLEAALANTAAVP